VGGGDGGDVGIGVVDVDLWMWFCGCGFVDVVCGCGYGFTAVDRRYVVVDVVRLWMWHIDIAAKAGLVMRGIITGHEL
jgi:hypothetical protein